MRVRVANTRFGRSGPVGDRMRASEVDAARSGVLTAIDHFPPLIADSLCLDFLNAFTRHDVSILTSPGGGLALVAWMRLTKMIDAVTLKEIEDASMSNDLDVVAARAWGLAVWFRQFVYKYKGSPLPPGAIDEVEPINEVLEQDTKYGQIVAYGDLVCSQVSRLELQHLRRWKSNGALLFPLAQAMAELICARDFTLVRECESETCTHLFLDTTRGHRRRWCSMAVCGNRAKQATYRGAQK